MAQIKLTNSPNNRPNFIGESQSAAKLRQNLENQRRADVQPQVSVYTASLSSSAKQFLQGGFAGAKNEIIPPSVGQWTGAFAWVKPAALQVGTLLDLKKILVANFDTQGPPAWPNYGSNWSTKVYLTAGITDVNFTSPYFTPVFSWPVAWLDYINSSNQFRAFNLERTSDQIYYEFDVSKTLIDTRVDYFEDGRNYLAYQYQDLIKNGKAIAYILTPDLSALSAAESNWFVLNVQGTETFFFNINIILAYTGIKSLN